MHERVTSFLGEIIHKVLCFGAMLPCQQLIAGAVCSHMPHLHAYYLGEAQEGTHCCHNTVTSLLLVPPRAKGTDTLLCWVALMPLFLYGREEHISESHNS